MTKFDRDLIGPQKVAPWAKTLPPDTEIMAGILETPGITTYNYKPLLQEELYESVMKAIKAVREQRYEPPTPPLRTPSGYII